MLSLPTKSCGSSSRGHTQEPPISNSNGEASRKRSRTQYTAKDREEDTCIREESASSKKTKTSPKNDTLTQRRGPSFYDNDDDWFPKQDAGARSTAPDSTPTPTRQLRSRPSASTATSSSPGHGHKGPYNCTEVGRPVYETAVESVSADSRRLPTPPAELQQTDGTAISQELREAQEQICKLKEKIVKLKWLISIHDKHIERQHDEINEQAEALRVERNSSQDERLVARNERIDRQIGTIAELEERLRRKELEFRDTSFEKEEEIRGLLEVKFAWEKEKDALIKAKDDLTKEQEHRKIRSQDILAGIIKENELHDREKKKALRLHHQEKEKALMLQRKLEIDLDKESERVRELDAELAEAKAECRAQTTVLQQQAEHIDEQTQQQRALEVNVNDLETSLQDNIATMEGDVHALRQLHEEERDGNERHRTGLPPPYGGLDQDYRPWWLQHDDAGPLDLIVWETKIRERQAENLRRLQQVCIEHKDEGSREGKRRVLLLGAELIKTMCFSLREFMSKIGELEEVKVIEYKEIATAPDDISCRLRTNRHFMKKCQSATAVRVGEFVVNLVLSVPTDLFSVNDLYGCFNHSPRLSDVEMAQVKQAYHEMGQVLCQGLVHAFSEPLAGSGLDYAVYRLRRWEIAVGVARNHTETFGATISLRMFLSAKEWLADQIEVTRMLAAAARDERMEAERNGE